MLFVNAFCSIKNVNETSRVTTKYAYLKSSNIRGLISDSIVITLVYGFFCVRSGGDGELFRCFAEKLEIRKYISTRKNLFYFSTVCSKKVV